MASAHAAFGFSKLGEHVDLRIGQIMSRGILRMPQLATDFP
ncbi:Hypothetical protein (plasmid) [Pseudomonas putida]|nr:Hypothetical protein [Pseudomonas putida]